MRVDIEKNYVMYLSQRLEWWIAGQKQSHRKGLVSISRNDAYTWLLFPAEHFLFQFQSRRVQYCTRFDRVDFPRKRIFYSTNAFYLRTWMEIRLQTSAKVWFISSIDWSTCLISLSRCSTNCSFIDFTEGWASKVSCIDEFDMGGRWLRDIWSKPVVGSSWSPNGLEFRLISIWGMDRWVFSSRHLISSGVINLLVLSNRWSNCTLQIRRLTFSKFDY